MKRAKTIVLHLAALGLVMLAGCTSSNIRNAAPGADRANAVQEERDDIRSTARDTLQQLYAKQPEARNAVENAAGHAVFSNFGMKILIAGSGTGRGVAMNKDGQEIFMRMVEVQAGLGFGVKKFRLVWVFETPGAYSDFVNKGYEFGGQAAFTAKAGGQGGGYAGAMSVSPGVWVYQITDDGLGAELTVKGTKYYRDKDLN